MNCQDIALLLDDRALDRLSSFELTAVDSHLVTCADCAGVWEAQRRLQDRRFPEMPDGVARQLWQTLERERPTPVRRTRGPMLISALLLVGAAAAMLVTSPWRDASVTAFAPPMAGTVGTQGSVDASASGTTAFNATESASGADDSSTPQSALAAATSAQSPATVRIVVLPLRHENRTAIAMTNAEALYFSLIRLLRAEPDLTIIELTEAELAAVDVSNVTPQNNMAVERAIARSFGADSVISGVNPKGPLFRLLGLPDPFRWELGIDYAAPGRLGHAAVGGRANEAPNFDNQLQQLHDSVMFGLSREFRARRFDEAMVRASDRNASEGVRLAALSEIMRLRGQFAPANLPEAIVDAVIDLGTGADSANVRAQAWSMAGNLGGSEFSDPLQRALLYDPAESVRLQAASALSGFLDDPAVHATFELAAATDAAPAVRRQTEALLLDRDARMELIVRQLLDLRLTPEERIAPLAESNRYRRSDEDKLLPPAQAWPPEMLAALAGIAVEARDSSARIVAVRELGRAGDAAYVDVLMGRLRNDSDTGVRAAAAVALERYFAELPEVREALQELGRE